MPGKRSKDTPVRKRKHNYVGNRAGMGLRQRSRQNLRPPWVRQSQELKCPGELREVTPMPCCYPSTTSLLSHPTEGTPQALLPQPGSSQNCARGGSRALQGCAPGQPSPEPGTEPPCQAGCADHPLLQQFHAPLHLGKWVF